MNLRRSLLVALGLLLVLHQDTWNWQRLDWVAGLPAGLAHHLALCVAAAVVLALYLRAERR